MNKLEQRLEQIIEQNLRVTQDSFKKQRAADITVANSGYIDPGENINKMCLQQNHVVYGRRGCGKSHLFLASIEKLAKQSVVSIYIDCEELKHLSSLNIIVKILHDIFSKLSNASRRRQKLLSLLGSGHNYSKISSNFKKLINKPEQIDKTIENVNQVGLYAALPQVAHIIQEDNTENITPVAPLKTSNLPLQVAELRTIFDDFFEQSEIESLYLFLDDFYHIPLNKQAEIIDFIHTITKQTSIHYKVSTMRFHSRLYYFDGQKTIGVQEGQDLQSIDLEYNFERIETTKVWIAEIFKGFCKRANIEAFIFDSWFGPADTQGIPSKRTRDIWERAVFRSLVLAAGGVPRTCLVILQQLLHRRILQTKHSFTKSDIRNISKDLFEGRFRNITNGITRQAVVNLRQFSTSKKTNLFRMKDIQSITNQDAIIVNELLDKGIIHIIRTNDVHRSYKGYVIDMGVYAYKYQEERRMPMNEIDVLKLGVDRYIENAEIVDIRNLLTIPDSKTIEISIDAVG